LLGKGAVEILNFSEVTSAAQWEYLIDRKDGLTVLVSTVAMWNSSEKDERLNVHRPCKDWGRKNTLGAVKKRPQAALVGRLR